MKNKDFENIEDLYKAGFDEKEYVPAKSFDLRLKLMLLYLKFGKFVMIIVVLMALVLSGFFGYDQLRINEQNITSVKISNIETEISKQLTGNKREEMNMLHKVANSKSPLKLEKKDVGSFNAKPTVKVKHSVKKDNSSIIKPVDNERKSTCLIQSMPFKQCSIIADDLTEVVIEIPSKFNSVIDKIFNNQGNSYAFKMFISPALTSSSYSGINSEYDLFRKNNESSALSWSYGADIQCNFNNWFIEFGLNYTAYKNKKKYDYQYQILDSESSYFTYDTNWVWIYDPPNLEYPVMVGIDTTWVPVYNEYQVFDNGFNEWKFLEVPIMVGYKYDKNLFNFEVSTGVSFGFLLSQKGAVPSYPDGHGMVELKNSGAGNNVSYNFLLKVGVSYNLSRDWSIMAQPYFKKKLNSLYIDEGAVDQRFTVFGIDLGLKYSF